MEDSAHAMYVKNNFERPNLRKSKGLCFKGLLVLLSLLILVSYLQPAMQVLCAHVGAFQIAALRLCDDDTKQFTAFQTQGK